jgi:hypothetical protein
LMAPAATAAAKITSSCTLPYNLPR